MVTLTATIDILKSGTEAGKSGTLSSAACNLFGNNVSSSISNVLSTKKNIKKPYILGNSKLSISDTFCKSLDYFMGEQASNEYGIFENSYIITIRGNSISAITLAFDDLNRHFPNSIDIDGKQYTDDDAKWTILLSPMDTHTITINNWNTPHEPLILSGIYIDVIINLDKHNLKTIERTIVENSDISLPSWGIISNTGIIAFNDIDDEVRDYAEQLLLKDGLSVKIILSNTLTKEKQTVGMFNTAEWNYEKYSRAVSVSLKDDLEEWQNINVSAINYSPLEPQTQPLKYFYEHLQSLTPTKYRMLAFNNLDSKTKNILENITVKYPLLKASNLWDEWNKLCQVSSAYIYKNNTGSTIFICS